jgi:hypothetical protein
MPGLVPGIHVFLCSCLPKTWMAGTSPAMTLRNRDRIMLRRWRLMTPAYLSKNRPEAMRGRWATGQL